MFYIQSRDSFFKFKQFKWMLKYVGFEVSQRAHYWIWGRPKGHVRGPKGHSPFGKCLARTLLVCLSSLYLTSLHMMRLLPPPTPPEASKSSVPSHYKTRKELSMVYHMHDVVCETHSGSSELFSSCMAAMAV